MVDTVKLRALIDSDPANGARTDIQVRDDFLFASVQAPRASMTGDEVFGATDSAEFAGLTDHHQSLWMSFCGRDLLDPFGSQNVALVQHIFGGGSATVGNLQSLRLAAPAPRWQAEGFPPADDASWLTHIAEARAL